MSNIVLAAGGDDGYQISRSVRLRSSASGYFNNASTRTVTPGAFTFSMWFKRGSLTTAQTLFQCADVAGASNKFGTLALYADDTLRWGHWTGADADAAKSNGVLRDPSAWYHAVFSKPAGGVGTLYLNGIAQTKQTTFSNDTDIFATTKFIGRQYDGIRYFDGYIAEIHVIDGQSLTPSSFGEIDAATGVWKPKKYVGTYGTGGYYLNFSDNSAATAAAIGKDSSGNGNNWTPNNISVTAGPTYDSMIDTPTPFGEQGNFNVWNPLSKGANVGLTNGNLDALGTVNTNTGNCVFGSIAVTTGKWYAEFKVTNTYSYSYLGVVDPDNPGSYPGANSSGYSMEVGSGLTYNVAAGPTITGASAGDTVMVALDMTSGKIWWGKNGTWGGSGNPGAGTGQQFSGLTGQKAFALSAYSSSGTFNANFGQRPFAYTPPTGFKALNTQNLPDSTINNGARYMAASLYTGNSATSSAGTTARTLTGTGFQPDLIWVKSRNNGGTWSDHSWTDSVRGANLSLSSNTTGAETNVATAFGQGGVGAPASDGFTIVSGTAGGSTNLNSSAGTYVGWQWKKGATPGLDIVTFSPNGSGNTTINHSLGVAPSMIITKQRAVSGSWTTYHASLGNTKLVYLNNTGAAQINASVWNNTSPTSTQFVLGSAFAGAGTMVAYLFSEVAGFSKFGSYTGNGAADGVFVYLGFRPKFIMYKRTDSVGSWQIEDTSRATYNAANNEVFPNLADGEYTTAGIEMDILSNGFKLRNANADRNASGGTYIYAAFAENPFKNSLAR